MIRKPTPPLLLALIALTGADAALAEPPALGVPAPLVKQTAGQPPGPAPAAMPSAASPQVPPKRLLYDAGARDPMRPAAPRDVANAARSMGLPVLGQMGLSPGFDGLSDDPAQQALEKAKYSGKYLGTLGSERVWRLDGTLYFEKIQKAKN